ncbi:hypothetical protein DL546_009133 [Coniochaeta pulveracea]|uniref:DUF7580 domain-containing protein n=1 Tax=Coniochaeta pulveracea TaxID=177199 RepID=A0A420YM22_9PEZI|nr:hypothetical protein DL546_009133 [Coniochaeta pulveracea]
MSGVEIAGLVLGAFPLAIEALDRYRDVAKRCGFWYKIQLEHRKCKDNLTFYRLAYRQQLKLLLLPLVQDGNKVQQLLADPRGADWKDPAITGLLEARLDESYELYKEIITAIDEVMKKLNHELALDKDAIQQNVHSLKGPMKARMKYAATKEGRDYQLYKLKFSNGESVRNELFAELKDLLDKMRSLLSTSDEVSQMHPEPTRKAVHFEVMIAKALASTWEIYQTKIIQGDGLEATQAVAQSQSVLRSAMQAPNHRNNQPVKSAMRAPRHPFLPTGLGVAPPTITLNVATTPANTEHRRITSLCASLNDGTDGCCGFLPEEDCRYYVYRLARLQTKAFRSVTLEEILGGQAQPYPTRRQRYTLSLTLASSFLQLLETPWLPTTWSKSDIVFTSRPEEPNLFALDQPRLRRELTSLPSQVAPPSEAPGKATTFHDFLDILGIVLLELCFGKLLKDQPCRRKLPDGANELEKKVFDYMAAREWHQEVNEEAGPDYADAVAWCLWGNRSCPPELWRRKMLEEVVQPLEQCRQYLGGGAGGGAGAGWAT